MITKTLVNAKLYTYAEAVKLSTQYFNGDDLAADAFVRKYALKRGPNEILEPTPAEMFDRMANALAEVEPQDRAKWQAIFREQLDGFKKIVPQGSPMAALGNIYQKMTLSNCYVVPIKDDSLKSIFDALYEMAQIQAYRGGVGIDVSGLRPQDSRVNNAALRSTGAWSWCDLYSYVTRMIGQSGRQGALMLTMDVSHPDIEKFVKMKADLAKVTGANVSVKLTDEFMKAVVADDDFTMSFTSATGGVEQKIEKTVKARELWALIVKYATETAEPGLLMWDTILRRSPADSYAEQGFKTICTNPCLTGDMRLLTASGYRTIEELWQQGGYQRYTGNPTIEKHGSLKIVNARGVVVATNVYRTADKERVYAVLMDDGTEIKATANHTFILSDGSRKMLMDLKAGDELPMCQETSFGAFNDEAYAEAAGWVIGDGSISEEKGQNRAIIRCWEDDIEAVLPKMRNNLSVIYQRYNQSSNQNPEYIGATSIAVLEKFGNARKQIRSSVLGRMLAEDGVVPGDKHKIPSRIWYGNKQTVAAFLRGLFSADGSVNASYTKKSIAIVLAQKNREILADCKMLLQQLGIKSSIHKQHDARQQLMNDGKGCKKVYNKSASWRLIISGHDNCAKYIQDIGFIQEAKNDKAKEWLSAHPGSNNSKVKWGRKIESITSAGYSATFCLTEPVDHEICVAGHLVGQCSEIPLSAYDSCRLTSLNLTGFVKNSFEKDAEFDWDAFRESIHVGVRILDNIVDIDHDLQPFESQKRSNRNGRRLGLGTHGLADTLARLNKKYDDVSTIKFVDKLYEFMKVEAYKASINLAKERGPFPIFNWEQEKDNEFIKELPEDVKAEMAKYGRRNIALLTCAPTGTVSLMSRTSSGIEPVFRLSYTRRVKVNQADLFDPKEIEVDQKTGDRWRRFAVYHPAYKEFLDAGHAAKSGAWVTSDEINYKRRVEMQAAITRHLDHASSSTINLPAGTSQQVVGDIYVMAWKLGLKGVTVYVDGSRSGVLITDEKKPATGERPVELDAVAHTVSTSGNTYTVFIGLLDGVPYEVFCVPSKIADVTNGLQGKIIKIANKRYDFVSGKDEDGDWILEIKKINKNEDNEASAFTRLVSTALRHGIPIQTVNEQLDKAKGTVVSMAKAINRVLAKYVGKVTGRECPNCQSTNTVMEEGCMKCQDCAHAKCG